MGAFIYVFLVTLVTQALSEFALHARAILGLPVDVSLREPGASAVIYGGMDAKGVAFEGVEEALAVYAKLGAKNRNEALGRAVALGVLR